MRFRPMRLPCDTHVRLVQRGEERPARLVNLGSSGARLSGGGPVSPGDAVTLAHLGLAVKATVVWRRGTEAGLRFVQPLGDRDLATLRGAGMPSGWRGGGSFREMT